MLMSTASLSQSRMMIQRSTSSIEIHGNVETNTTIISGDAPTNINVVNIHCSLEPGEIYINFFNFIQNLVLFTSIFLYFIFLSFLFIFLMIKFINFIKFIKLIKSF